MKYLTATETRERIKNLKVRSPKIDDSLKRKVEDTVKIILKIAEEHGLIEKRRKNED